MATRLYTPSEYASLMRVTPQYVRRCCADGTVKAFRMSIGQGKRRTWRIPFDEESIGDMAHRRQPMRKSNRKERKEHGRRRGKGGQARE